MISKQTSRGTLPPLFDRIVDDPSGIEGEKQFFTSEELKASIISELSLILNTRCTLRKIIYEDHLETIPLFGGPDFFGLEDLSAFNGSDSLEWPKIARFIETAIQEAEPRLENVRVSVESYDASVQILSVVVYASVRNVPELKDIHFPLRLTHGVAA